MACPIQAFGEKENKMSVPREFRAFVSSELGCLPGEIVCLTADRSGTMGSFLSKKGVTSGSTYTSIALAEDSLTTGRNDTILVTPESHAWRGDADATATALTWDKTNTHIIGLSPTSKAGYNRARFSHSGYTMANFITVSGADNCFKNVRFMHGSSTGGASDLTCAIVSGDGNRFENVSFAGPNDATQAATAGYLGVRVSGSHNYFKGCMFGSVNDIDRSAANAILSFDAACGAWNIFEDCVFRSRSGGGQATAYFINDKVTDTVVDCTALFLNCQFIHSGTALTLAIAKAANASRSLYFDNRCTFTNVTDVVADAREAEVIWGVAGVDSNSAAIGDRLYAGIARSVMHTS
jgi:hypothetical protein